MIPAKNEIQRLPATLDKVLSYLSALDEEWEVIVVDNGSTDDTPQLVRGYTEHEPRIRLMREERPGKGVALRTGMIAAEGKIVLFSDADLSCPIEEEQKLRSALNSGVEVAIASRRMADSEVEKSLKRIVMSTVFNWIVQALALPGIKDSQCGFKAFTREAAQRLFSTGQVDGWAFDVEILFLARKFGYRIKEIPVRWHEVGGSRVSVVRDSLRMFRDIIKFRYHMMRGRYGQLHP